MKKLFDLKKHSSRWFQILICGSRHWSDREAIEKALQQALEYLPKEDLTIMHGWAKGADQIAEDLSNEYHIGIRGYPADWEKHGKAAGPLRNQEMIDAGPDVVLAFTYNLEEAKGTKDTVTRARKANIPVFVFPDTDGWYEKWKKI